MRYKWNGARRAHVVIAEAALGRALPEGSEVHHVNGDGCDNRNENLVICPDRAYHALLHARERARDACGDPWARRCFICGEWDHADAIRPRLMRHKACHAAKEAARYRARAA